MEPFFHLLLCFTHLVIICGALKFYTKSRILITVICNDNIWLTFHVSFFPRLYSFTWCILIFTKPGHNDSHRIEPSDVLHNIAVKISHIFYFEHVVIGIVKQLVLSIFSDGWEYF